LNTTNASGPTVSGFDIKKAVKNNTGVFTVYGSVLITFFLAGLVEPDVFSVENILTILHHMASLGVVAIGQTFCILSGTFDLSVGSVISLSNLLFSGTLYGRAEMLLPALLLALGVGVVIGLINGLLIAKARINPFVTTLAMMAMAQGAALMYYTGPYGKITPAVKWLGYGKIGPIPVPALLLAFFFALGLIVLTQTRFGLHVYAMGGGLDSARLSGVKTVRMRLATHVICSVMAVITGIYYSARMGTGDPYSGVGVELESIAAVCIAGTSLFGGRGSLWGTLGGVMLMTVLSNAFNHLNLTTTIQLIIRGAIIIAAVGVHTISSKDFGK
jgi:ribose transport system permease protein